MNVDGRQACQALIEDQMSLYGVQPHGDNDCESDVGEHFRAHAEWWREYSQQVQRGAVIPGY
ncbi:hypothetical protein GUITHDRAFT_150288 [Guillardia theta CCMP2712]|uniref:Uncharacterized protein n=1 Tax=Guillardia theta (strain CCMP2712) TaxID=905079 RepID=L1K018_GUITC|nr:hypothetical protein GUITHDRAFT_150288 [Guillardia theta CCMP2712]EKX53770.1 hypothetical protein GUITHDRAFT_150288 [Guillardia theta CCMP2712]|eukprot:XP_005840750.1 hypothetical protein GUITHDRAFT_150288 [Guillardia theta CCMP2712]